MRRSNCLYPPTGCKHLHVPEAWDTDIGEGERGRGLQNRKTNQHLFQGRCSVILRDVVWSHQIYNQGIVHCASDSNARKCVNQSICVTVISDKRFTLHRKQLNLALKRDYIAPPFFFLVSAQCPIFHLDVIWQVLLCKHYPHIIMMLAFSPRAYERQRSGLCSNHRGAANRHWYILSRLRTTGHKF